MLAQVDTHQIEHGVLLRDLDALALARRLALDERRQDADGAVEPRPRVPEPGLRAQGRAVRLAREAHRAAHRLGDPLEALVVRVGPAAEALDRRGDKPGVDAAERVPAEAQALDRARPEVLDEDVGPTEHPLEEGAPARGFQIEGDAALVGVEEQEEPRVRVGPLRERAAARLAARRLDLDDVRAEPREHLGAARPRLVLREVEDDDPVERLAHVWLRRIGVREPGSDRGWPESDTCGSV